MPVPSAVLILHFPQKTTNQYITVLYKVSCALWQFESTVGVVKTAGCLTCRPVFEKWHCYTVGRTINLLEPGAFNVTYETEKLVLLFEPQSAQAVRNYYVKFGNVLLMGSAFNEYPNVCGSSIFSWRTQVCFCTWAHIPFAYSITCSKIVRIKRLKSTERVWPIKAKKIHALQLH